MKKPNAKSIFQWVALLTISIMSLGMQFPVPSLVNPASNMFEMDRKIESVFVFAAGGQQQQRKSLWAENLEKAYQNQRAFEISA